MPLADGLDRAMRARGLTRAELMEHLPRESTRWAVYRLLAGTSVDPRLSTILSICQALEMSPTELAQFSGLIPRSERGELRESVRLRQIFRQVLQLDEKHREIAMELIEGMMIVLAKRSGPSDAADIDPEAEP